VDPLVFRLVTPPPQCGLFLGNLIFFRLFLVFPLRLIVERAVFFFLPNAVGRFAHCLTRRFNPLFFGVSPLRLRNPTTPHTVDFRFLFPLIWLLTFAFMVFPFFGPRVSSFLSVIWLRYFPLFAGPPIFFSPARPPFLFLDSFKATPPPPPRPPAFAFSFLFVFIFNFPVPLRF